MAFYLGFKVTLIKENRICIDFYFQKNYILNVRKNKQLTNKFLKQLVNLLEKQMIINDINYLEATNEEVFGGLHINKDVNIDVEFDLDFDADVDIDVNKDIDADLKSNVNISGNFASALFDVTAIGNNSFAESDVAVTVTGGLSEISGLMTAAVK